MLRIEVCCANAECTLRFWYIHSFCQPSQQVWRWQLPPFIGREEQRPRVVTGPELERVAGEERVTETFVLSSSPGPHQQTEKAAQRIKGNEDAITVAKGDLRCHWKSGNLLWMRKYRLEPWWRDVF